MKGLHYIAFILLIIGGLNWGLVGLGGFTNSNWNVISLLLDSSAPWLEWLIYILVGLSAIVIAVGHKKDCRLCGSSSAPAAM